MHVRAISLALALWMLSWDAAGLARAEDRAQPGAAASGQPDADRPAADKGDDADKGSGTAKIKTREVKLNGLTLQVPETWEQGKPSSRLRLAEFKIPPAEGDDDEQVELAVFSFGGGGSVRQNVERWINQFDAGDRKVKVTRGEAAQGRYVLADVSGTYQKPVGPPILQKTEPLPDARMLAVILQVKDGAVFYLKLAGPKKTVASNAGHLRKSFGADADKEQPLDLDGEAEESETR